MAKLDFEVDYSYEATAEGIVVPVEILVGDRTVGLTARLDTGAADCVFDSFFAEVLGIQVNGGDCRTYRTVAGSFVAYGHEVTLRTLGLEWSATVYFYAAATPRNNFIGRRGWLDRVRLGLVHYDQQLYLGHYNRGY